MSADGNTKSDTTKSKHGLSIHGITEPGTVHWNLDAETLLQTAVERGEGTLTDTGALSCETGEFTGRSPKDKFIVKDATTKDDVDWGSVNQPMTPEHFATLRADQLDHLQGKELYVREAFGGADPVNRIPIRVVNETAWANLFCHNLFIRPEASELEEHLPQFTIIHTPSFSADPARHGTNTETFVVVNFTEGLVLIGGTKYAGEMKKSIFSVLNFLYPLRNILSMHCSANVSKSDPDNCAIFFGLSGTGKTTLSADPNRNLIGDDEHGWGDKGVFNFEGGCYAKCINLTHEKEPQIWDAIHGGTILENVVLDDAGKPDYDDGSLTENTRAAYPLEYIDGAIPSASGPHPRHMVFLTCDAFGVMPPLSRLTPSQAMYHFLSGYTAKVAGTERGVGDTPQATFSTCFGSPFIPLRPRVYAELLGKKIVEHDVTCWLVNTGWIGGSYGVGKRISLKYTRRMIEAALSGELDSVSFRKDPVFGLEIPESVPDVPCSVLNPREQWEDPTAYDSAAKQLVELFTANFKKFDDQAEDVLDAGPSLRVGNS